MFNSNLHNIKKEFHVFATDDFGLSAIGMSTYSLSSISGYFARASDDEMKEYFSLEENDNIDTVKDQLIPKDLNSTTLSIFKFNKETLKYELKTNNEIFISDNGVSSASNLVDLLQKHRKLELGYIADDELRNVVKNIQTSLSGCITFNTSYTVLGAARNALIRVYLQDRTFSDNARQVAQKGQPFIADVLRTSTGSEFSRLGTELSQVGVYQRPFEGGVNNPKNTVAAPLDIRYSSATGKWHSGTHQILAKLLTDIDPAPQPQTNLDNIDTIKSENFYNPDKDVYFSEFKIGMAAPLSLENGNPYQLGPNFVGCPSGVTSKIEKIMVVNRSGRSFKKGDTVLCSHIDNEWIVQGFDAGSISTKKTGKIGKWSFQKYIVNSDNFFKDARFVNDTPAANGFSAYARNISPDDYETKMRLKYYKDMFQGEGDSAGSTWAGATYLQSLGFTKATLNNIAKLNMYIDLDDERAVLAKPLPPTTDYDLDVNAQYYQSTIFDQLSEGFGGTNDHNVIGRTNVTYATTQIRSEEEAGFYAEQRHLPFFWGPVFPDGYSTAQLTRLKATDPLEFNNVSKIVPKGRGFDITVGKSSQFFSSTPKNGGIANQNIYNVLSDDTNNIFSDTTDGNAKQLPAEVALNGFKNAFASPIESPPYYTGNTVDCLHNYLVSDQRYSWLAQTENNNDNSVAIEDTYGLSPIKPNVIQFSPLQLEASLYDLSVTPKNNSLEHVYFKNAITSVQGYSEPVSFHSSKFYSRHTIAKNAVSISNDNVDILTPYRFGPYVKQPTVAPLGGADIIPKENSSERGNLFGIIAAKNKFSAPADGSITFLTKQYFGLTPRVTIAGGQGPVVTIIGAFLSWSTGANPIRENANAQWGDRFREDKYDSNGTTALHMRIFDQWPDYQTIYDGRYFSVLHFNPIPMSGAVGSNIYEVQSELVSSGVTYSGDWTPDKINVNYQRKVDKISTSVDFRVPTLMHPQNVSIDNSIVPIGTIINGSGALISGGVFPLRPQSEWKVNPIRRGALLTKGGFKYHKATVGVNGNDYVIASGGSNYAPGDIINFAKEAKVRVVSANSSGGVTEFEIINSGVNLSQFDFGGSGLRSQSTDGTGLGAIIYFRTGRVYSKLEHDLGPQERVGITRLSLPSNMGKEAADGNLSTPVSIQGGTSNQYDAFYFMHNDILHTLVNSTAFTPGFAQYINLEIGIG